MTDILNADYPHTAALRKRGIVLSDKLVDDLITAVGDLLGGHDYRRDPRGRTEWCAKIVETILECNEDASCSDAEMLAFFTADMADRARTRHAQLPPTAFN